ncbi:MAG: hypothetical protein MI725_08710, partial [Pirellulales bacterium]|nr:hypothetical protein [Pirellulales bacterium]
GEEELEFADRMAEQLVVSRLFRGAGEGAHPTSLLTVVEARDAYNEPVDLDGEVSLMVMTADANSPQRLHRWDFTREETLDAWQSSELGDGLHLELPLKETRLPPKRLELWVRMVAQDGRKLLTQVPFESRNLVAIEDASNSEQMSADSEVNALRPLAADQEKEKPRWRASMQRSHAFTENYATTAPGARRWSAQPPGGRLQQHPAPTVNPTPTSQPPASGSSPQWVPYR